MPEAAASQAIPSPTLAHVLSPKLRTVRNRQRATASARGTAWRWLLLGVIGVAFWAGIMFVLVRLLRYFKNTPEIGALLAGKLLGLVFLSFFAILLISNIITALSSFFLARDLDMLASAPVDWLTLYGAKLLETLVHSSWMVVLMAVPILAAYGFVYDGGVSFILLALGTMLPYLIVPAAVGAAVTLLLVNVFPARRTKDLLSVVTLIAVGALVVLFRLLRPEQLARPEGLRSLVDFIALLRTPTSPFLPSDWVQRAIMTALTDRLDVLPLYLLWSTAAAAVVLGAMLHRALYAGGFSKAQESAQQWARTGVLPRAGRLALRPLGILRRELVCKEVRVFFRDTTQWSQLILLAVLVVVYVFNVKFLPLRGQGIGFLLVNVVPFLNLGLSGFVLASIAARFIFPSVSVEGRTLWLLKSSPLPMRELLWSKYWCGTLPLLGLALLIVGVTDALLQVSPFIFAVSVFTIAFLTFAVAGLALGLGAIFPRYESESAAQIPTSFGGLVFMLSSAVLIGAVVLLEARPVYSYLSQEAFGTVADPTDMVVGFSLALAVCLAGTFVPLSVAVWRLERLEL
ncbi:MAG TPA: hypothetical protein VFW04_19285 [Gemmatimonadaceae bacterium]|nr:hypothetical protein [Gemmatimonadaceae bacterium]